MPMSEQQWCELLLKPDDARVVLGMDKGEPLQARILCFLEKKLEDTMWTHFRRRDVISWHRTSTLQLEHLDLGTMLHNWLVPQCEFQYTYYPFVAGRSRCDSILPFIEEALDEIFERREEIEKGILEGPEPEPSETSARAPSEMAQAEQKDGVSTLLCAR